jgi:dephospho-CoA kinase
MKKLKSKWITKSSADRLYQIPVPIIGLTGGIATGKSTVAEMLRTAGLPVIDADRLVKNVYQTSEAVTFVSTNFNSVIADGKIDFKKLRAEVFSDHKKQEQIEQFIYSKLPGEFVKAFHAFKDPEFVIYDVPLLFEKKLDQKIDVSVCVYSPRTFQLDRLMKRDSIEALLANKILDKQMDIEEKKNLSDLFIENVKDQHELSLNVQNMLLELFS